MGLVQYALRIPFIFENKLVVAALIGLFLSGAFLTLVFMQPGKIDKSELKNSSLRTTKLTYLISLSIPFGLGLGFASLIPISVDFLSSEVARKVFIVTNLEQGVRSQASLYDVVVIDTSNQSRSFLLSSKNIRKLNLKKNDTLKTIGRNSYFGFLIDNINGIQVN